MGKRVARALAAAAAEEKRKLGIEQEQVRLEKEGIVSRQLGARRSAFGRAASTRLGAMSGGGLMSSPEQRQQAQDIELVSLNLERAGEALETAQKAPKTSSQIMGIYRADPLAPQKNQLEMAKADIQRVNRGERPLLQAIKMPEKKKTRFG